MKGLAKGHLDTDNSAVMARGKGGWELVGGSGKAGRMGTSVIVSTIKKVQKPISFI